MSAHKAIRWVPTRPLVVKPQTKKAPNSSQNTRCFAAQTRVSTAVLKALLEVGGAAATSMVAPKGRWPASDGRSGISSRMTGIRIAAAPAMVMATTRQPKPSVAQAISGMKIREPVAVLAVSTPIARPRWVSNHRLTMVAARTIATQPEPIPDSTPQVAIRCQGWVMKVDNTVETAIRARAQVRVRRTPRVCIRAAANGPIRP